MTAHLQGQAAMDMQAPVAYAPEVFLDEVDRRLDWHALGPWVSSVEARARTPLSIAIFKMLLLRRWFALTDDELDDACHAYEAFRRFLGAPLHGPVAEVWMFRQFADTLQPAGEQIARFLSAVELLVADRGLAVPSATLAVHPAMVRTSNWLPALHTTVLEPGTFAEMAKRAESAPPPWSASMPVIDAADPITQTAEDPQKTDRFRPAAMRTVAKLEWPWGLITPVTDTLRIGREPGFSPFSRQLWADPRISRRHALVEPHSDGICIRDLNASNGTYVGDELIPPGSGVIITHDAEIRFGPELLVRLVLARSDR